MAKKPEDVIKSINDQRQAYVDSFSDPAKLQEMCKDVSAAKADISEKLDAFNTVERNARKALTSDANANQLRDAAEKDLDSGFISGATDLLIEIATLGGLGGGSKSAQENKETALARAAASSEEAASDINDNINSPAITQVAESRPDLKSCIDELTQHLDSLEDLYDDQEDNIDTVFGSDQIDQIESSPVATAEELEKAEQALKSGDLEGAKKAVAASDLGFQLATGNATQEEINDRARFVEQCFLLKHMDKLIKDSKNRTTLSADKVYNINEKSLPPDGFVNQLVHPKGYENIFNITPAQLSGITPSIELYKVFKDDKGKGEIDVPIIMNTHNTADELNSFLNSSTAVTGPLEKSRGMGAGLKSMTLEFDGNNFFTAKRNIKSKLKLFFASFEELLRLRDSTNGRQFSFIDLMMKTPGVGDNSRTTSNRDANPHNYRLKVVLGWAAAKGLLSQFSDTAAVNKNNLENSGITVQLIPVTHTINVGENGQVEVEIEYRAYIDSITASVYSNILSSKELYKELFDYDKTLKEAKAGNCKSDFIRSYKNEAAEKIDEKELDALTMLLGRIDDDGALNHAVVPNSIFTVGDSKDVRKKITILEGASKTDGKTATEKATADAKKAAEEASSGKPLDVFLPIEDNENKLINYFFLSDLIRIATDQIQTSLDNGYSDPAIVAHLEQFKKIRILLGPFAYFDDVTKKSITYSLGDIPISLNYFSEFFMSKTIKDGVSEYTLYQFLNDITNIFITKIFASEKCMNNEKKNELLVRNAVVTSAVASPQIAAGKTPLPQTRRSNSQDEYTYLIYYATTRVPQLNGIRSEDQAKGIYHFDIGANSGLVKSISFSKNNQKYVKETRFERDGIDGLGQLREAYDISIQMYGNVQIYPGMYIYINPIGISPSLGNPTNKATLSHLLGLGGYHMVTKVDSIVAEGQFDTTITAKWVSSGSTQEPDGTIDTGGDIDSCPEPVKQAAQRDKGDE